MRRVPLVRTVPLRRRKLLTRPVAPVGPGQRTTHPHKVPDPVRREVLARAQGRCEGCGRPCARPVLHHRRMRSQQGPDETWNLVSLHVSCHRRVHEQPARAYGCGLLLRAGQPDLGVRPALWLREAA